MTSKAALCKALLDGKTVNIMNGFHWFNISNVPREVGRSVERAFGVKVTRQHMRGESVYGQLTEWVNYTLQKTPENLEGMQKMCDYVNKQMGNAPQIDANGSKSHDFPENDARVRNENHTPKLTKPILETGNFVQLSLTL